MSDLPVSDLPVSELEYHLSSVRDGKSLLESMYVLSLALYNLTACKVNMDTLSFTYSWSPGDSTGRSGQC